MSSRSAPVGTPKVAVHLNFNPLINGRKICSNQLGAEFIMLINVKMTTNIGILTFISMINTTSESFKTRTNLVFFSVF